MLNLDWANRYVGIPYKDNGRSHKGVDCYGLVCLIYKQELDITLPSFVGEYSSANADHVSELMSLHRNEWELTDTPELGDVVLLRIGGLESHVGICLGGGKFLHAMEGYSVAVDSLEGFRWSSRVSGYYKYGGKSKSLATTATLTAIPHPLNSNRITTSIPAGTSLRKLADWILKEYSVPVELKSNIAIIVNTVPIPESQWDSIVVHDGDVLEYRALPRGGSTFRMLLTLAVIIAAPQLITAMGSIGGVALTTAAGGFTVAGSIAVAAAGMVGMMLVNAIAPVALPKPTANEDTAKQYMVTGGSNSPMPHSGIPFVLGKVRHTPPLGSQAFVSYGSAGSSNLNYFNMLLCWGYGPLEIYEDTLKLGEVSISNYEVPAIKHLEGKPTETDADRKELDKLYGIDVEQKYSGLELVCDGDPGASVTPGPWAEIATTNSADSIEIAINFPQGCRALKTSGKGAGASYASLVIFGVECQLKGSSAWLPLTTIKVGETTQAVENEIVVGDFGQFEIVPRTVEKQDIYKDPFVFTKSLSVTDGTLPSNEGITVRIRRETGDNDEVGNYRYIHSANLNTVTFRRNAKPVREPVGVSLAMTALKIQATEQLTNKVEGINAIVQTICLDWDGTAWVSRPTNNPASLYRYVLESSANPRRVRDAASKIDLNKLQYWHTYCASKGFQYNSIAASQKSVLEVLREICAAGRASPGMQNGKWTVNIDEPQALVVQHFSPHNSWGFESTKSLPRIPDGIRITYYDEDQQYQEAETIVYNYGKDESTAELLETMSFPGVTKLSSVIDHAKWHYAQVKLRPETYTINTDFEYLVCNRGDRVKVTHDVPMWGLASGRIRNKASSRVLDLDVEVPIALGKQYSVMVRSTDVANKVDPSASLEVKTSFVCNALQVADGSATIYCEEHPFRVGDTALITLSGTGITEYSAIVASATAESITVSLPIADSNLQAATGVLLCSGYYRRIRLVLPVAPNTCMPPDLFLYGELHREAQDLVVLNIETTSNKSARLTLVDYGVTDTYNIFTDYLNLSASTAFETQITLPPALSRDSFGVATPTITSIFSDRIAAERLSPGTWQYQIKVGFVNSTLLPSTTEYVECQYGISVSTTDRNVKSIRVPYYSGSIAIPDVVESTEYKVRLRYVSSMGTTGKWTSWTTHVASGFTQSPAHQLVLSVDRATRYLNITPYVSGSYLPEGFSRYEVRVYKSQGTGDFWDSTDSAIKTTYTTGTASINLRDFATPRLSLTGVKYRIAVRMLDTTNTYISSSALSEVLLTNLV